jgi:hypothetical protein
METDWTYDEMNSLLDAAESQGLPEITRALRRAMSAQLGLWGDEGGRLT